MAMTREQLVSREIRARELMISGENQTEVDSYFDTTQFVFHGPGGIDVNYADLMGYFAAVRAGFDNRSIRRGIIVAEGDYMAWRRGSKEHLCVSLHIHWQAP